MKFNKNNTNIKLTFVVAVCAVMGFVACGKGNKNNSAKIRSANQAAAKAGQQDKAGDQQGNIAGQQGPGTQAGDTKADVAGSAAGATDKAKTEGAVLSPSGYSDQELFSSDIKITVATEPAIIENLKITKEEPARNELECTVVTDASATEKTFVQVLIKQTSEKNVKSDLKLKFEAIVDDKDHSGEQLEVSRLRIAEKKDGRTSTVSKVTKKVSDAFAISYKFTEIPAEKLSKFSKEALRLSATIVVNADLSDVNSKPVTINGSVNCAVDFTEAQ